MSFWNKVRDTITNPATIIGAGLGGSVGGATGSTALGNTVLGNPTTAGLTGAAGLDVAGLGLGVAAGGSLGSGLGLFGRGVGMTGQGGQGTGKFNDFTGQWEPSVLPGGGTVPVTPDYLGGLFNLAPVIGAGYLGNRQRQDIMGQVGKVNESAAALDPAAFMGAITNPYDLQTGQGRTELQNSLTSRGVMGSSFGDQSLNNYDYMRGLGRGDLAARAGTQALGTQGALYSSVLPAMAKSNESYNNLLGAGLGASGNLMMADKLKGLPGGAGRLFGGGAGNLLSGGANAFGNMLTGVGSGLGNVFGGNNWWNPGPSEVGIPGTDIGVGSGEDLGSLDPETGLLPFDSSAGDPFFDFTNGLF